MCEDPDMIRWGLHLLQVGPSLDYSDNHHKTNRDCNGDHEIEHTAENSHLEDCISVENDEVIAQTLQEELSQVAFAEASGNSHSADEQVQASVLRQRWLANKPSSDMLPLDLVVEDIQYLPSDKNLHEDEDILIELSNDFAVLDGEVCKRLSHMTSIPHVPKVNGEIPTEDEASSDHQRLLDRLKVYDLIELKVQGDGNCQFRSLSDQLYLTPEHHKFVRDQVVKQLKKHREIYEGYVLMPYHEYIKKMSKSGEWGDHVTLQAAADLYGVRMFILTSFKETCYIEILPSVQKSNRVIHLSFWAEVHYNSIYPEGEFPILDFKKKKKWWQVFYDEH